MHSKYAELFESAVSNCFR